MHSRFAKRNYVFIVKAQSRYERNMTRSRFPPADDINYTMRL